MKQPWCRDGPAGPLSRILQRETAVPCPGTWEGATRPATPEHSPWLQDRAQHTEHPPNRSLELPVGRTAPCSVGHLGQGGICLRTPPSMRGPAPPRAERTSAPGSPRSPSLGTPSLERGPGGVTGGTAHLAGLCSPLRASLAWVASSPARVRGWHRSC